MMTKEDFEMELKPLASFKTIEEFWGLYQHMLRPSELDICSKLFLFQGPIRPLWEDEANKNGGRFYIRIKKDGVDKLWEALVIAYISENFEYNDDICGLQMAIRPDNIVVLSLWVQGMKSNIKEECSRWLRDSLNIPSKIKVEYQDHPRSHEKKSYHGQPPWDKNQGYRRNNAKY